MALGHRDGKEVESETFRLRQSTQWLDEGHSAFHPLSPLAPGQFSFGLGFAFRSLNHTCVVSTFPFARPRLRPKPGARVKGRGAADPWAGLGWRASRRRRHDV